MSSDIDVSDFWCWNEECPDYGKKGQGNIRFKEYKGKCQNALLRCKTCGRCFSETRGTPFHNQETPADEITLALSLLPEKGSIRAVGRVTGHKPDTIIRWIRLAGAHAKEVNEYFLQEMEMTQVQVDEIWAFIKKKRKT